jgi:hypothetical protein
MQQFVRDLDGLPEAAKEELAQLTPWTYIGNAVQQVEELPRRLGAAGGNGNGKH